MMRGTVRFVMSIALLGAAAVPAWAQAPVPLQRSMDLYAPLQAKVAEQAAAEPQQPPAPPLLSQRSAATAASAVNKDRFGNVVRGTTCAEHPANCAYDPTRARQ
jgi:hypothetical protein